MALLSLGIWLLFGEPKMTIGSWLYPDKSAPWEEVVGFYYPNQNDTTDFIESPPLATVMACRRWALEKASEDSGAINQRSNYGCAIGKPKRWSSERIYRLVLK